jgi:transcriptional regulator with XRE-family HTH domain
MSPEAQEFVKLMRVMSWNQSETARQLHVTSSFVNQIANGKAEPSASVLHCLRLTVQHEKPGAISQARFAKDAPTRRGRPPIIPEWGRGLISDLAKLDDSERSRIIQKLRPLIKANKKR